VRPEESFSAGGDGGDDIRAGPRKIEICCSLEQIQDLLFKVRDATKQVSGEHECPVLSISQLPGVIFLICLLSIG
jgi:hypothetical protein